MSKISEVELKELQEQEQKNSAIFRLLLRLRMQLSQ